ncbi:AAA family ATPase [uncultured Brachyspira sp.]|uniref:AAA family ATPase n=2 Tax=uncultured Brachyspira sp. TaxID=221953 RepID=UPI0025EBFA97|nr:AAA family ATPase [uncultured Brachyspira sp.]
MSYLCFGSNWGNKKLIDEIFLKYKITFVGFKDDDTNYEKALEKTKNTCIAKGAKIAIAEGTKVKAVGIAISDSITLDKLIQEFSEIDREAIKNYLSYIDDTILCVKSKLYKLSKDDQFSFGSQGKRFCNIKDEKYKNYINKLLKKYSGELAMKELKENCISLLKSNYNLVLTGAPGTGKTYLAKEIAKEMMKDNTTQIKDYIQFIIDYYNSNKERLNNLKKEGDKLREEFKNKFPKESLQNISIDDYAVGRGDNNSFCYWIEFGLKRKLLGGFFAGGAKTYLLYYDKKTGNLVNETDKTDDELIKEIGKELYNMATTEDYDFKDSVLDFNKRNDYMAIKIYNTYNPNAYFPMMPKKDMLNICDIFGIKKDNNIYELNKNIKKFFDENLNGIDSYIVRMILLENLDLISGKKQDVNVNNNDYGFVQFHPSYDYTDFVEGLRPVKDSDGNIGFERKDGVFKKFCKEALKNRSSKFVFIIDEINRGEISKIFGELFFAVDPGYRGESGKVKTQYNNLINNDESDEDDEFEDGFFVPENVYIIGTMNDIDRSVESMDFAMRRRFAFIEIEAKNTQENILKSLDKNIKQEAINRMDNLNNAIEKIESFNSSYHVGASYFLKLKNYYKNSNNNKEEAFKSLWDNHLKGLLFEYLRGMPDAESKLDDELKKAYDNDKVSDNNAT